MRKLKALLVGSVLGIMVCGVPVQAAHKETETEKIEYQTCYETESATTYNDEEDGKIHVVADEEKEIFTSEPVDETVYTTVYLNLRQVPTINSTPVTVLEPNSKIKRVGDSECGWDIIQIDGVNYFMWDDYLTEEEPEGEITTVYQVEPNRSGVYSATSSNNYEESEYSYVGSSSAAKEEIARRESGGDYNAVSPSGKYIGRYQLDSSYLNGDYSPENQERVADNYVANRYGSWEAALEFWNANGWY